MQVAEREQVGCALQLQGQVQVQVTSRDCQHGAACSTHLHLALDTSAVGTVGPPPAVPALRLGPAQLPAARLAPLLDRRPLLGLALAAVPLGGSVPILELGALPDCCRRLLDLGREPGLQPGGGLSVDRLPPLTHVLGRLLFYSIL